MTWTTCAVCGNPKPPTETALRVRSSMRPWTWSRSAVQDGHLVPGQPLAAAQQRGLVGLDREQVVGLLAGDEEPGGVGVGVQRIGRHHGPVNSSPASSGTNPLTSPGAPLTWR